LSARGADDDAGAGSQRAEALFEGHEP
jgi:hypothetical protein